MSSALRESAGNNAMEITRHTTFEQLPEYLTVDELRAWWGIGRSLAFELVRKGDVPSLKVGRLIRIPKASLLKK